MQETDTSFMKTIENVKSAEQKASSLKQGSEKEAEKITLSTKKKAEELRLRGEKEALDLKEKKISEGKKTTERDVGKILSVAEQRSAEVNKNKAGPKEVSRLMDDFLKAFQQ